MSGNSPGDLQSASKIPWSRSHLMNSHEQHFRYGNESVSHTNSYLYSRSFLLLNLIRPEAQGNVLTLSFYMCIASLRKRLMLQLPRLRMVYIPADDSTDRHSQGLALEARHSQQWLLSERCLSLSSLSRFWQNL